MYKYIICVTTDSIVFRFSEVRGGRILIGSTLSEGIELDLPVHAFNRFLKLVKSGYFDEALSVERGIGSYIAGGFSVSVVLMKSGLISILAGTNVAPAILTSRVTWEKFVKLVKESDIKGYFTEEIDDESFEQSDSISLDLTNNVDESFYS